MKAVAAQLPPGVMQWRRRIGADRRDEMWQGVLHMNPVPNRDHQELAGQLGGDEATRCELPEA